MADRIYRTQMVLDTSAMQAGAAAADTALVRVANSTDALSRHLEQAASAGSAFERQQLGQATAQARATSAVQAQSEALAALRSAAAQGAAPGALGAPGEGAARQALAGIRTAAQARERSEYQSHQQALDGIRSAALGRERSEYQAQQQFLQGLQRQADTVGKTRGELLALQAAQLGVTAQAAPMIARLAQGERQLGSFGKSGKLSAMELQQVGYQLNDLAVQVASGQNPLTALVQQGSQLSGTFGGIGAAARALGSLITPMVVGVGALAAGIGAVGYAYVQGQRDDQKFRDSLVLTGNAAGITRGQFNSLAVGVQAASGVTIGAARDITQQLVATGQIGPNALGAVARAAATLARISGQSADEVVKDFAGMAGGVAKWAFEHNKSYNFLTAETYRYIKSLEAQGKTEEAMRVAAQALDEALKGRAQQLGYLEQAWQGVTKAMSGWKEAALSIGRADTTGDQVQQTLANLAVARERLAQAEQRSSTGGGPDVERRRAIVAQVEANLESLRLQQRGEREAAEQSADTAATNREALLREQEAYQNASTGLQRSGLSLSQAQAAVAREAEQLAIERSYDQGLLSLAGYSRARTQIERQAIEAKRAAIDQDIALERKRQPGSPPEKLEQQARLNELLARRTQLEAERLKLSDQARRNFGKDDKPSAIEEAEAGFAKRVEEFRARNEIALDRQVDQAQQAANEIAEVNKRLSADLISDDQARGQAVIAIEVAQQRARISALIEGTTARKAAEADLAEYIRLRNAQLAEQVKPEWQKLLDGWADTNRLMKETHDRFLTGFVQQGEEAWLEFNRTGKLNLASMGRMIQDELARLTYRQFIAPAVASIGNTIAGAIGIKAPGAAGDAGLLAAKAAETAAVTNNTVALTAMQTTGVAPANAALALLSNAANAASAALARISAGGGASGLAGLFGGGGEAAIGNMGADFVVPGFAKGGAFDTGQVQAYARGGVLGPQGGLLTRPTIFPMGKGAAMTLGLGGEAGTEAVMPLKRTRSGALGVVAEGGVQAPVTNITIIGGPAKPEVTRQRNSSGGEDVLVKFKEAVKADIANDVDNGTGLARNVGQRFGLNSGAGLMR